MNDTDSRPAVVGQVEPSVRPLPEPTFHGMRRGGLLREDAWTAEQMRAYAAEQVAAERERWKSAVLPVLGASEGELPHAIYVLAGFARA